MKNKAFLFSVISIMACATISVAAVLASTYLWEGIDTPSSAVGTVNITVLGLIFIAIVVEVVSTIKIADSTYHTALLTSCLFVLYLCSADSQMFFAYLGLKVPTIIYGMISELAFIVAALSSCIYIMFLYGISANKKLLVMLLLPITVMFAIYAVTLPYGYGYIAHSTIAVLLAISYTTIIIYAEKTSKIGSTTYFVTTVFAFGIGAQNVNSLFYSGVTRYLCGATLFFAVLTFAMYIPVYLMFSIHSDSKAVKSTEYKYQAEKFESRAMVGQIKPHFIFNSLDAVRSLYHQNIASGDAAINYLSDFLRKSISSFDTELVPFETELDTIYSYTEFENLKRENKIEVIFNIDFVEFSVPPFSIQPFVENAFKYSGVDKTDGSIIISSYKADGNAVVEITDNGKGFDINKISDGAHGIKNACSRFALTLGANPVIKSSPGKGTAVRIVIELGKELTKQ